MTYLRRPRSTYTGVLHAIESEHGIKVANWHSILKPRCNLCYSRLHRSDAEQMHGRSYVEQWLAKFPNGEDRQVSGEVLRVMTEPGRRLSNLIGDKPCGRESRSLTLTICRDLSPGPTRGRSVFYGLVMEGTPKGDIACLWTRGKSACVVSSI